MIKLKILYNLLLNHPFFITKFNYLMKEHQYIYYNDKPYTRFDIIQNNLTLKNCTNFLCTCPTNVIHVDQFGNIFNCLVKDENNKPVSNVHEYDVHVLDTRAKICKCFECYNYLLKTKTLGFPRVFNLNLFIIIYQLIPYRQF